MMPLREGAERADEVAILETPFAESFPALSPDGRWLVYLSDETGVVEVYIRGFGNESGRWQVSAGGGIDPAWSADGRAIYFRQGNSMLKVDFALHNEVPLLGKPEEIFQAAFADPYGLGAYSVDPADGTFVATVSQLGENEASRGTVVLILNADQILQRVSQGR